MRCRKIRCGAGASEGRNLNSKARERWGTPVEYLGLILSEGHIETDPVKVGGVAEWPTPWTVTEVWSFLGFYNFYRCII